LATPLAVFRLARFFRRERFDVVQHHIFISMRIARPAAWLADVPIRLSMIAGPFHLQAVTSRWIEKLTYWMDTKLIPSCQATLELCRGLGISERYLAPVVYYSPDERNFDPAKILPADIRGEFGWPADTPLVCMVAFFYQRLSTGPWVPDEVKGRGIKGHGDLVKAASIILQEFPKTKFLLVGSGWGHGVTTSSGYSRSSRAVEAVMGRNCVSDLYLSRAHSCAIHHSERQRFPSQRKAL